MGRVRPRFSVSCWLRAVASAPKAQSPHRPPRGRTTFGRSCTAWRSSIPIAGWRTRRAPRRERSAAMTRKDRPSPKRRYVSLEDVSGDGRVLVYGVRRGGERRSQAEPEGNDPALPDPQSAENVRPNDDPVVSQAPLRFVSFCLLPTSIPPNVTPCLPSPGTGIGIGEEQFRVRRRVSPGGSPSPLRTAGCGRPSEGAGRTRRASTSRRGRGARERRSSRRPGRRRADGPPAPGPRGRRSR